MFKKITLVLAAVAVTSSVYASRIDEGTLEIGTSASLAFVTENGANFKADLLSMYFVRPSTALGGRLAFEANSEFVNFGAFLTVEQHIELDSPFIPYLGVDVGILTCSYKNYDEDEWDYSSWEDGDFYRNDGSRDYASDNLGKSSATAMVIALRPGFKLYFTDMVCLDASLDISLASNKIYKYKRGEENKGHSFGIRTGLRYAFF